jgi:hypothetical protein
VIHASVAGTGTVAAEDVAERAEALEELLVEVDHQTANADEAAELLEDVEAAGADGADGS